MSAIDVTLVKVTMFAGTCGPGGHSCSLCWYFWPADSAIFLRLDYIERAAERALPVKASCCLSSGLYEVDSCGKVSDASNWRALPFAETCCETNKGRKPAMLWVAAGLLVADLRRPALREWLR